MSTQPPNEDDPPERLADVSHYIVGDDSSSVAIAERLRTNGQQVAIVGEVPEAESLPTVVGDPSEIAVLSEAGIEPTSTVIVATRSDRRNLLIAQLVRAHFGVSRVIPLVNDPTRSALFEEAGHEPICVATALSTAVEEVV